MYFMFPEDMVGYTGVVVDVLVVVIPIYTDARAMKVNLMQVYQL